MVIRLLSLGPTCPCLNRCVDPENGIPNHEEATITDRQKPHTFLLQTKPDEEIQVQGRQQAIHKAKELSRKTWRGVRVIRQDERVRMRFRRGELQEYQLDTRDRPSRRPS